MIFRAQQWRPISSLLLPLAQPSKAGRCLHQTARATSQIQQQIQSQDIPRLTPRRDLRPVGEPRPKPPLIPKPTPFVPDAETFLTLIGRGMSKQAGELSWEEIFTLSSEELAEKGLNTQSRRYLLDWRKRFREGDFGIGGDLQYVENGVATLHAVKILPPAFDGYESGPLNSRPYRAVVNVPSSTPEPSHGSLPEKYVRVRGLHVKGASEITGPYALTAEGGRAATIRVTEGMWEDKKGRKIDGGERRQAQVRAKKRAEEKQATR